MSRIVIATVCLALAACGGAARATQDSHQIGTSPTTQRHYELAAFDKVASVGPHLVFVSVGGPQSVRAEGPAATLDKLETVVERGELQIRPKREYRRSGDWRDNERATFFISMPRIAGATMAGSGDMQVDKAQGPRFAATVAGSGTLEIAALQVDDAQLSMAGSGELSARGNAVHANVTVAGSGHIDAHGVSSRAASVSIAGSGDARLTARDTAVVSIVGSGDAEIGGGASCTVTRIGSGNAHCSG